MYVKGGAGGKDIVPVVEEIEWKPDFFFYRSLLLPQLETQVWVIYSKNTMYFSWFCRQRTLRQGTSLAEGLHVARECDLGHYGASQQVHWLQSSSSNTATNAILGPHNIIGS